MTKAKYWIGDVGDHNDEDGTPRDSFNDVIVGEFIDGMTRYGPWAIMSYRSWVEKGCGKLGMGYGQRYRQQSDGRWLKVEG